jgi:virulence-associated protein VagC
MPELGNRQYRLKLVGSKTGSWNGQLDIPGFIYGTDTVDAWQIGTDYKKGTLISPVGHTWDEFFLNGPKASEDFMSERATQQQADREAL